MADHFCLDRAIVHGCYSEIRNVNCIRKRIDFLFWYHCYGCFICIRVHKIRDWVFEHQLKMADGIRSVFQCLGSVFFILGFKSLPLADAFVIASLLPLASAILGFFLFNERVSSLAWPAMLIGSIGVAIMFLDVMPEMRIGYVYLIRGVLSAPTSLVIARYIGKFESNPMALIFWPSLLMTLGAAVYIWDQNLSFATQSFEFTYLYACLLLFGRWLRIYLINFISAHLMTAIFNLQFVWFVIIGYVVLSDVPSDVVWIGAIVLVGATTAVALYEYRDSKES
jgi:drug/metabolite transporter (DMT)-like permease